MIRTNRGEHNGSKIRWFEEDARKVGFHLDVLLVAVYIFAVVFGFYVIYVYNDIEFGTLSVSIGSGLLILRVFMPYSTHHLECIGTSVEGIHIRYGKGKEKIIKWSTITKIKISSLLFFRIFETLVVEYEGNKRMMIGFNKRIRDEIIKGMQYYQAKQQKI